MPPTSRLSILRPRGILPARHGKEHLRLIGLIDRKSLDGGSHPSSRSWIPSWRKRARERHNGRTGEAGTASLVGVASERLGGRTGESGTASGVSEGTNGKGWNMSALGTRETAGTGLGLEPPLSPPIGSDPGAQQPPAATARANDYFAVETPIELEPVQPTEIKPPAELPLVAPPEPDPELEPAALALVGPKVGFRLVVRLQDGERVEIGEFEDFGTAKEAAQEAIEQFTTGAADTWPFYAGSFIRPDLIVSVDLVEAGTD